MKEETGFEGKEGCKKRKKKVTIKLNVKKNEDAGRERERKITRDIQMEGGK